MPNLIEFLQILSKQRAWSDNPSFSAFDHSGGDYDEAYNGGYNDGETILARYIIDKYMDTDPETNLVTLKQTN